jgi:hypothetical protein
MTSEDFNLPYELEQIERRAKANLEAIERIAAQDAAADENVRKIRHSSLDVLKALEEIEERSRKA